MVLRAILRNVQNTLILSSVFLVILALQRLQKYEFPHQMNGGGGFMEEGQQESDVSFGNTMEESAGIISLFGSHHQVVLGKEFHFGLFRFFLPRLERASDKAATALKQEWEVVGTATSIHYVVDFLNNNVTNVCDPWTLDAASVLHHSLEEKIVLHAIVDSEANLSCNATSILSNIGYRVVPSNSITLNACSDVWQAYAIQKLKHVDVVVHLPVTSIAKRVVPTEQLAESHRRERRRALSSSVYSSSQSIQLLRPKQSTCATASPTVCHASPCQISRHISLLVPPPRRKKCIMPWSCGNNDEAGMNATRSSSVTACRIYHHLWTQTRNEAMTTTKVGLCDSEKYIPMHDRNNF
jgi:hypothetical protein